MEKLEHQYGAALSEAFDVSESGFAAPTLRRFLSRVLIGVSFSCRFCSSLPSDTS